MQLAQIEVYSKFKRYTVSKAVPKEKFGGMVMGSVA
jgi:hypothetical protein